MTIRINLDVMMAKRKIGVGELAEQIGITPANVSILKRTLEEMGNTVTVERVELGGDADLTHADFVYMGAGTERAQKAALLYFSKLGDAVKAAADAGVTMLFAGNSMELLGKTITDDDLRAAIKVMNKNRAARRAFVQLANEHCDVISAVKRSAVLRAAWFMEPAAYAEKLEALNAELAKLPAADWKGKKIVTSGIICDNPKLLQIFDDNKIAIAADDVAQESRAFRVDASEEGDPMMALAQQFADQDYDILLYDEHSEQNRRADFVVDKIKKSGAQGLVLFMQQFCDPEEMEYPYLKKALDAAGIPHIKLGVDQQMRDFGQASTAIQAFADVL